MGGKGGLNFSYLIENLESNKSKFELIVKYTYMNQEKKSEIEKIAKEFASGFDIEIKGSGWLIVDPLSAYLNTCGFKNSLGQIPATDETPLILIMTFEDGTRFIPAGSDITVDGFTFPDWCWVSTENYIN